MDGNEHSREERIRERAYDIWEREGRRDGDHERHWEKAEAELRKDESGIDSSGRSSRPSDGQGNTEGISEPVSPPEDGKQK
ncbi:DUF2934 domain-containing protein [Sinorhizobium medicae]|uniref:DUF2934 domain-containing protein n=1 Tax=Sinorhizobium medicae TaxID=110321 RepID=A0A508XC65_9HYPH|nr:DUF2934 domain-containing protein [Sinorhizobium medicae]RVK21825.1 DUF2934 domain-containing protein [Sinorhizobium medicae]VTZ65939.1 conserved hypothetical protein [Sinorhizobium medicae]